MDILKKSPARKGQTSTILVLFAIYLQRSHTEDDVKQKTQGKKTNPVSCSHVNRTAEISKRTGFQWPKYLFGWKDRLQRKSCACKYTHVRVDEALINAVPATPSSIAFPAPVFMLFSRLLFSFVCPHSLLSCRLACPPLLDTEWAAADNTAAENCICSHLRLCLWKHTLHNVKWPAAVNKTIVTHLRTGKIGNKKKKTRRGFNPPQNMLWSASDDDAMIIFWQIVLRCGWN